MNLSIRHIRTGLVVLLSVCCCLACAGRSYLIVDYAVPPATDALKGQTVRIAMVDDRVETAVLAPQAAARFTDFADRYSLAWVMPNKERVLAGEHDLLTALAETFKKRLTQMGAVVSLRSHPEIPVLTVSLTRMTVDLQERKWIVELGYEAVLRKATGAQAKETVRGNAERVRVIGRKGADMVLSDIFSDATNRLDLVKMFKQAQLLP
jgi:hypothetical protein